MKVIALIDGEHHPTVTRWGLASARTEGFEVLIALLVGGLEKFPAGESADLGSTPVRTATGDPMGALADAIDELRPEGVLDLADEPVLTYERRMELVAVCLARGLPYLGPDFRFEPPVTGDPLEAASLAVIGTGKRVGKTALTGQLARLSSAGGHRPVVVAMGRGGPAKIPVARADDVSLEALLARAARGEHAASDFLEDALTAGVPTIGARRFGGGLAGRPFVTNVGEAASLAVEMGAGLVILEGSGASVPNVPWDAGVLVAPSSLPTEHLAGYLGPLRVLLSDALVLMMGSGPFLGPENLSALDTQARRLRADIRVAIAELQPVPLTDVRGKDVFFATTAQREQAGRLARQLEDTAGCRVIATSCRLGDRAGLEEDLAAAGEFEVLLTELKAAAVEVAVPRSLERGAEIVFVDNRPVSAPGGEEDLDALLEDIVNLAETRAAERLSSAGAGASRS